MFSPATSPSAGATADFTANLAPVLAAGFVAEVQLTVVFSMDERFFSHVGVGPAGWFDGGAFFEGKFQSSEASFKMKFRPEKITSGIKWFVEGKGEAARRKFHVLGCHFRSFTFAFAVYVYCASGGQVSRSALFSTTLTCRLAFATLISSLGHPQWGASCDHWDGVQMNEPDQLMSSLEMCACKGRLCSWNMIGDVACAEN